MKVAIIGANGQLGFDLSEVCKAHGADVVELTHNEIHVEDIESVRMVLGSVAPDLILNTAAFHNVPQCEASPARAFAVNSQGALHIAKVAADLNAAIVYYSTDYVFDGAKREPYLEVDVPNPLNVYAITKLSGEHFTLNYSPKSYVIRVSGLYGIVPCRAKGGNFITTMIKAAREKPEVSVVGDEVLTPTSSRAVALNTLAIVESGTYGLYHLTCEGQCSWYEFAREIFSILKFQTPLKRVSVRDFPNGVKRPFYSVLENRRFNGLGPLRMPEWQDALSDFLKRHYISA